MHMAHATPQHSTSGRINPTGLATTTWVKATGTHITTTLAAWFELGGEVGKAEGHTSTWGQKREFWGWGTIMLMGPAH